ncbi:HU family DNA-binding protein [Prevotella sp. OH937_COT-195]|uniref:HU family DNA-binding protein n=1 Tax=Prevotella sp. OH937_COT-195 TaxID=2491051 RepID=UPI000F6467C3|nr:HU family DNA-binding protein [Prevotella sp. OH937_COT-195]RRD02974.1 HU family DNA-binding protein [Prevotella sp. OH937_COT-195]
MAKVTFQEMASRLAERKGISIDKAQDFLSAVLNTVNDGLHKDKLLKIKGLGTFKVIEVKQRKSVDVNTGEEIIIDGREKITFTPDAMMKDLVNKPFSQFETVSLNDGVDFSDFESSLSDEDVTREENVVKDEVPDNALQEEVFDDKKMPEDSDEAISVSDESFSDAVPVCNIMNVDAGSDERTTSTETDCTDVADKTDMKSENLHNLDEKDTEDTTVTDGQPVENECEITEEESDADSISPERQYEKQEKDMGNFSNHNDYNAWKRWIIVIVLIALFGSLSYYLFDFSNKRESEIREQMIVSQVMTVDSQTVDKHVADSTAKEDTVKQSKRNKEIEDSVAASALKEKEEKARKAAETMPKPKPEAEKKKPEKHVVAPKASEKALESSRRLVKYGAYDIVGTDRVITVKKGQTMTSVAKVWLGKDMACYIEVHNGTTTLTEGQKLKIPKLKLKKKTRK